MATYNGETYIADQLASIARQTVTPCELVVCDDGSKDRTVEVVQAFAAGAAFPVKIFRNATNLGYEQNFLKAASLTTGELVAFCDQDDMWQENKLASCSSAFAGDPDILLCVHSGDLWDGTKRTGLRVPDYRRRAVYGPLKTYPLQGSFGFAMVVRRELLQLGERLPLMPHFQGHDLRMWTLASVFGKTVLLPDALVLYRQHGKNVFGAGGSSPSAVLAGGFQVRDYASQAKREDYAAAYFDELASHTTGQEHEAVQRAAARMRYCAGLNRVRQTVYDAPLHGRVWAFAKLGFRRGYTDPAVRSNGIARPPSAPFWRAPLKDWFIGVLRVSGVTRAARRRMAGRS
ncbi:MAG: glycosyltransferase family 2 protein [Rhodospirillales bacterium]|nr:glycosyltransferase family 2 protein [Acetobacter sp.]